MSSGALFGSLWNDAEFPTLKLTDPGSIAV
jgi:hypothetical protein